MRIAIWHNLPSGGGKRALYHHVKGLVDRGHQVESWCPPDADRSYLPLSELIPEHVVPLRTLSRSRSYLNRFQLTVNFARLRLRAMNEHCYTCARQMEQGKFDLLFANSCYDFATTAIGRLAPIPGLLYLQEPFRYLYEALPESPWAARPDFDWKGSWFHQTRLFLKDDFSARGRRLLVREEINNAKAYRRILVNSFFSRESLLRYYGLESHVCYLGVDAQKFSFSDAPRKLQVVGVGYLHHPKGVDRVIRALAAIPPEKRPSLLWVGNGCDDAYRRFVEQLARENGVAFQFREKVSDAELIQALQESYAAVYLTRLEPFGYGPLEANCCGLPVIGVAEGGIRETVQDGANGFLLQSSSPAEIAGALIKLLDDPQLTDQMRWQGRQLVEQKWSIEDATLRLEQQLLAALHEPAPEAEPHQFRR